jgi:hypothetical protein
LGLLEPTASGLAVRSAATCITADERREAQSKCVTLSVHGLGQPVTRASGPMEGRLAGMDPCKVLAMPSCPIPKCLDVATAQMMAGCIAGTPLPGVNCNDPWNAWTLLLMSTTPYCSRPPSLQVPPCLSQDALAKNFYCLAHPKFDGPNKLNNAYCWAAMKDAAYWNALQNKLPCPPPVTRPPAPPAVRPPPPPPVRPPPVVHETTPPVRLPPPVMPPGKPPRPPAPPPAVPIEDHWDVPPPEEAPPPEQHESAMFGVWGVLALVAVGGGGYYLYRRYKR